MYKHSVQTWAHTRAHTHAYIYIYIYIYICICSCDMCRYVYTVIYAAPRTSQQAALFGPIPASLGIEAEEVDHIRKPREALRGM